MAPNPQKECVVARLKRGGVERGYARGFDAEQKTFRLVRFSDPTVLVEIPLAALKAVFFVRTFRGDPERQKTRAFSSDRDGLPVRIGFRDGEILYARAAGTEGDLGYWFVPDDPADNAERIFVPLSAAAWVERLSQSIDPAAVDWAAIDGIQVAPLGLGAITEMANTFHVVESELRAFVEAAGE